MERVVRFPRRIILKFFTDKKAPEIINRARLLREAGAISEAIDLLEVGLTRRPRSVAILKEIANAKFEIGDDRGVLEALQRVEILEPLGPHTKTLKEKATSRPIQKRAQALRKSGRPVEALNVVASALEKCPDDVSLLKLAAVLRFELADYAGVVDVLDQVESLGEMGDQSLELHKRAKRHLRLTPYTKVHYYFDPDFPVRPPIDEMVDALAKHELISFDIFDTAIVRAVSQPNHVFRLMGSILGVTDFTNKRKQAEDYARKWNDRLKGTREVTLDEIYDVIETRYKDTSGWKELETDLEIQLTRPNPYILSVYERLKSLGKRMIFTSDMYLPRTIIEQMLARAGYDGYENIYLSCEHAARKGDGGLQAILRRDFGPDLSIAHVGDVFDADVTRSNEAGITGVFNPNQHGLRREHDMGNLAGSFYEGVIDNALGTGTWAEGLHYTHGFRVGGLLALGYLEFLDRLAKKKGVDKIIFLGRDCDILSKIYTRFLATFPSSYVDTSRAAALMLTCDNNFDDYISRTFFRNFRECGNSKPLSQLLDESGFGYLMEHLEQADIEPLQFPASANEERLREFFWSQRDIIEPQLSETREIAAEYFSEAIGDARTVLAVDIGWSGTCITTLKDFLRSQLGEAAPTVLGALMGTSRREHVVDAESDGSITAFLYSSMVNQDITRLMMPSNGAPQQKKDLLTLPIEYLFTEPNATTISYARDNTGKPVAVRGSNMPQNVDQILEMQRGIMDFVERYLDYSDGLHHLRRIGAYTAFQPMRNALGHRPYLHAVYKDFLYDAAPVLHGDPAEFQRFGDLFSLEDQRASAAVETDLQPSEAEPTTGRRILFVSPEMKYVGAPRSLLRLCKVAAGLGFEPIVWTERAGPFSREFEAHDFPVQVVTPDEIKDPLIQDLKDRNVELVVCNTVVTDRYVKAFEGRLPVVWYVREATNLPQFLRGNPERAKNLRTSSSVTVVSDYAAEAVSHFTNGPVEVVRNAVEDVSELARPYEAKKNGVVRFVQLGTIEHRKGYDVLVAAYKAMPEAYQARAELHFAGGFINSATSFASYLFGQAEGEANIHFHGLISDNKQKIEHLSQMDVVVVASRDESCSLVALEGAMLSKPLIVTENVGAKYMVGEDNGIVVAPGNVTALRDALMSMIDRSAEELSAMGTVSRRTYEAQASMEVHSRDLEHLFLKSIANGPVSPLPIATEREDVTPLMSGVVEDELIVSLTSYPPRISTIAACVASLKKQSKRADRILLWLSQDQFPGRERDLPNDLLELTDNQFEVRWVEGDLGPHKKYFYAAQEFPDAAIITVDDDVNYDKELVAALYQGHLEQPDCVVAGRSNLVRFRPDGAFRTYDNWAYDYQHLRETKTYALLPTGIGGVLYPSGALPPETFDVEGISTTCLHADDLWLKVMTTANGYPVWMPRRKFAYRTIGHSQAAALWRKNSFRNGNDQSLELIVDYVDKKYQIGKSVSRRIWGVRDDGTWVGPGDQLPTNKLMAEHGLNASARPQSVRILQNTG